MLAVAEIRKSYVPKLAQATSSEETTDIAEKAQREMLKAVKEIDGIDLNTYLKISETAQRDQELSERIDQIADDVQSTG